MRKSIKIFALTEDTKIQQQILIEFKKEDVEICFFSDEFSVITLMQFQPDMIIIDYGKREFVFNQFSALKKAA